MDRNLKNTPIQSKLRNVILLSCAIVVLLMSTAYTLFEYITFRDTLKNQVHTLASIIGANCSSALAFDTPQDAIDNLKGLKVEPHIVAAALYDTLGHLFAMYPPDISAAALPARPGKNGFRFGSNSLEGFDTVFQKKAALGVIYLKSDMEDMYAQMRRYILLALLLFGFSLFVAYLISRVLQKSISEPILSLEQTARRISEKADYSVRAKKNSNDELGALTDAFNHMLTRIEFQNREIHSLNQGLEEKIAMRTNALREANETLKEQKEFVETIINSSIDIIGVFDREMNYVMLNTRAEEFYSFKREDLIGKNVLDSFPQLAESQMVKDLQQALNGIPVIDAQHRSTVINRIFQSSYIPLKNNSGDVYGALILSHDITNIMESHEKLTNLNAELLKSNRDLEQFAYVASHDLQEPLRKIQVFTQLIGETPGDADKVKKYHDKINQSASRMQELIKDVLNFSRISKKEDAFEATDLNKIIKNLETDFELAIQESGATITCDLLPTLPGIPMQLSQLFHNLISNSLKYTDKKPLIKITSRLLEENEIKNNYRLNNKYGYTLIIFSDNGIGFEAQYNEKIFTIFQRLHGQQAYHGTGIGLALCRKIVENHQGIITASGEPGQGAEFRILLPDTLNEG